MQLQFNKSSIRCLGTALQQVQSTEATQELRLPDGMPDIGRVLTTWGQVILRSKQWLGDEIQITGGVMLWVLYAPEDGTEPRCVDSWLPFQMNWNVEAGKREGPIRLMPMLTLADSRSISARKLMLRAGVSAVMEALTPMEAEIYSPGETAADIQLLRRTYPMTVPMEAGEKTFLIDEELTLPDMGTGVQKLLSMTVHPEITEKRVMSDKVIFKGILAVCFVCRYDDGEVRAGEQSVQFSQLADLDNTYGSEAQADIRMAVTSLETDMAQPGKIRLKCGLVGQYLVDDRHVLELVQDAYSTEREILPEESVLQIPVVLDERMEYVQVEQSVPGQTGRIADARFLPEYPGMRHTESGMDLDLSGRFQILSYDWEEVLQGAVSRWNGCMQINCDEGSHPLVTVKPMGRVQTVTGMDDTNLNTQLQLNIRTGKTEQLPMITGLEVGQVREPDPSRPSVILTKGSGESLWDLAKQSNSTVSAIHSANDIDTEIAPERMILIPVM